VTDRSAGRVSELEEFVRAAIAKQATADVHIVVLPAPAAAIETFLALGQRAWSFLWHPHGATGYGGFGTAYRIELSGAERFEQLRASARALWRRMTVEVHPTLDAEVPRLFGGISFVSGQRDSIWGAYGDGAFTLPRWCYRRDIDSARLSLAFLGSEARDARWIASTLAELDRILAALETPARDSWRRQRGALQISVRQVPPATWCEQVEAIRAEIAAGRFEKIVAARRCDIAGVDAFDDLRTVSRLADVRDCYRFAFRRDRETFLGASPETLFRKVGRSVTTEALAGTLCADADPAALLASSKDRVEHDIVVSEIYNSLGSLARSMSTPTTPIIRKVRNLFHLSTPISARLRDDIAAAEVLRALHPTPAVGGLPTIAAMQWIADREARGWYTGAVGWLDADDDATFAVAIRCALLTQGRAHLYTGAGIVADSEPLAEYKETAVKQLPMFHALGIDPERGWVA
jgi:menaquinone-specific isochorismate synthase